MYLALFGREYTLTINTLVEAMIEAVDAFKNGWEVDVINTTTGEIIISLRDGSIPYFSTSIHETTD